MAKYFFLFSLVAVSKISHSQGVTSNWHFGNRAGITFQNFTPFSNDQNILTISKACTSISDIESNMLFYAKPDSCIDATLSLIEGGENFNGSSLAYQGALFIPNPIDPALYNLFVVNPNVPRTLYVNTIRKTLSFPEGAIQGNEKNIIVKKNISDKLTAVHHANGTDIWLISRSYIGDTIFSFLIQADNTISAPVISVLSIDSLAYSNGQLKASPNGRFLAETSLLNINATGTYFPHTIFYKFDNVTGIASNKIALTNGVLSDSRTGIEFSDDSRFVYVAKMINVTPNRIYRYDIGNYDSLSIINSIDSFELSKLIASLQIGIDRKIYGSQVLDSFLLRIENPNQPVFSSINYDENSVSLNGNFCGSGLPDFITSYFRPAYFDYSNACIGDSVLFMQRYPNPDSVRWNFGDPASADNTSQALEPKHLFSDTGSFTVTLRVYAGTIADTFSRDISLSKPPQAFDFGDSLFICSGDSVTLDIQQNIDFAKYYWSTGSDSHAVSVKDTGQVWGVVYNHCDTLYDTTFVTLDDTLNLQSLPNTFFCEGDTLILSAQANERATWLWSNGDTAAQTQITGNGDNEIETWVTATNACGSVSDTAIITVLPQPNIDWFSDSILCDQSSPTVTQPNTFGVAYTLLYNNNSAVFDTVNPWNIDTAGLYYLVAENSCDTLVRRAFLSPQQIIEKELLQAITLCPGEEVVLDAFWEGSSYAWSENVDAALLNDSAIVVSAPLSDQTGSLSDEFSSETYTVTITNPPCSRTLSTTVIFLSEDSCGNTCAFSVPNVFTPNQDGVNDAFRISNSCESQSFRFSIYNRWGTLVHSGTESIAYWAGTSNGAYVNSGVYFLIIEYTDSNGQEKTVKASVSVLR